jgi:hypothetical protein
MSRAKKPALRAVPPPPEPTRPAVRDVDINRSAKFALGHLIVAREALNEIIRHVRADNGMDNPNYAEEYTTGVQAIHELEGELFNIANLSRDGAA